MKHSRLFNKHPTLLLLFKIYCMFRQGIMKPPVNKYRHQLNLLNEWGVKSLKSAQAYVCLWIIKKQKNVYQKKRFVRFFLSDRQTYIHCGLQGSCYIGGRGGGGGRGIWGFFFLHAPFKKGIHKRTGELTRIRFGRCRLSCLLYYLHYLSIPLHANS